MKLLCGFIGAILGAVLGSTTALFLVALGTDGDSFAMALSFTIVMPIGLIVGGSLGIVVALRLLRFVRGNQRDKAVRWKNVLAVAGSILAVPILVAAMLWGGWRLGQPPSDQQLLNNFARHKATFNELSQMVLMDKNLTRVDYDWTDPSDPQRIGVPPERIAKYRSLLESVGLHRGFSSDGVHSVEFISYGQGSAASSDEFKGYMYFATPPKQVLKTLDYCHPDEKKGVEAYRLIEGHWYLYYEYLPG